MNRARAMARIAEIMADDPMFGYSNKPPYGRWGPDFDCSSFVYFCAWLAGYPVGIGPGKVRFTGTMLEDFKKAGFQLLPFANVGIGDLKIGDILVNLALHAEICVGNRSSVGAMSAENGGYSGEAGDQTGGEIEKHPVYIYEKDWDYVLRPPENVEDEEDDQDASQEGDDQEMAYPYSNTTAGGGNWMPNSGMNNMPRSTVPAWMPPAQNYGGYPQGNVGQLNGYSSANAGYQQPGQMAYGSQGNGYMQGGYPQGSQKHLIHVNELNEVRDIHVNPGECVPVFIGEGKYMALKSADQEGFPNMRVFELNECTEEHMQGQQMGMMQGMQQGGMHQQQGVSREEFDQLKEMIANVQSAISGSGFPQGNGAMDTQANAGNAQSSTTSKQGGNRGGRSA